jgi:hypothetical protein
MTCLMWFFVAVFPQLGLTNRSWPAPEDKGDLSIQGKLAVEKGKTAVLESGGKATRLTSDNESIAETFQDVRLSGRELKLAGKWKGNGSFEVHDFFVVHGDKLFRLIYFCDTCNITTFSPGICLCCQQPTVPMEVPLTDRRVYHEEIKSPTPK